MPAAFFAAAIACTVVGSPCLSNLTPSQQTAVSAIQSHYPFPTITSCMMYAAQMRSVLPLTVTLQCKEQPK